MRSTLVTADGGNDEQGSTAYHSWERATGVIPNGLAVENLDIVFTSASIVTDTVPAEVSWDFQGTSPTDIAVLTAEGFQFNQDGGLFEEIFTEWEISTSSERKSLFILTFPAPIEEWVDLDNFESAYIELLEFDNWDSADELWLDFISGNNPEETATRIRAVETEVSDDSNQSASRRAARAGVGEGSALPQPSVLPKSLNRLLRR